MKSANRTIKTKPREVRGRVVRTAAKGGGAASYYTGEQLRALHRESKVSPQETTPEGDAVSNVEDSASQAAEKLPYAAYRLTRAQIRFIKARREKARQQTALASISTEENKPPEHRQETKGIAASSKRRKRTKGDAATSPTSSSGKAPAAPLDDPNKRALSDREIAKARENQRKKRNAEIAEAAANEVPEKNESSVPAKRNDRRKNIRKNTASVETPAEKGMAGKELAAPSRKELPAEQPILPSSNPRIRQVNEGVQHPKPEPSTPKTRKALRYQNTASQRVIQRHEHQAVKTADAATRTTAKQAAALAGNANAKLREKAAEQAARNAEKAAKHMTDLARRSARRTADQLQKASKAALRACARAAKALANIIEAGGGIVVVIIIVLLMCVCILASPFGIFTHTDEYEFSDATSLEKAITIINGEYQDEIARLAEKHNCSQVVIQGCIEGENDAANWVDVLATFAVHLTMREENAMDVVQLDKQKLDELRKVFWDMNSLSIESDTDGEGHTTRYVVGTYLTSSEMAEKYKFSEQQKQLLTEITSDTYYAFWSNFISESMGYGPADWSGVTSVDPDYTPSMSGNKMKIPAIYQFDYKKVVCVIDGQGKSVSTSGCGATSMCMVIHYLTGNTSVSPYSLFKWAYENGHYHGSGLDHEAISALGKLCGVKGSWVGKNGQRIVEALKAGHPVIAHMGPGIFTKHGHYIVLKGVTDDGKILVNDPNSKSRTGKAYPLSTILKQSKTSSPFMICSPAN